MSDIFSTQPGAVSAVRESGIPMMFTLQNWHWPIPFINTYPVSKCILTDFTYSGQSDVGYMHALRDFISVYSFGEHMGVAEIKGIAFAFGCNGINESVPGGQGQTQFLPSYHGIEYALKYYIRNRVSSTGSPLTIWLGFNTWIYGFLDAFAITGFDTKTNVFEFSMKFGAIPQPSDEDLVGG